MILRPFLSRHDLWSNILSTIPFPMKCSQILFEMSPATPIWILLTLINNMFRIYLAKTLYSCKYLSVSQICLPIKSICLYTLT